MRKWFRVRKTHEGKRDVQKYNIVQNTRHDARTK